VMAGHGRKWISSLRTVIYGSSKNIFHPGGLAARPWPTTAMAEIGAAVVNFN